MAILYGFFDESGKQADHPVVAFSGVCATQSQLERFNDEWEKLLRYYDLQSFHMVKMVRLSKKIGSRILPTESAAQRINDLKPFADCINDYLEIGLVNAWDVEGFKSIPKIVKAQLGSVNDPYYIAFARMMMELADHTQQDDKIGVICDHDEGTALTCLKHFNGIRTAETELRKKIISLTFADDAHFPALQAADLVAYLARLEAKRRFLGARYDFLPLLDYLTTEKGSGKMKWFAMFADKATCAKLGNPPPGIMQHATIPMTKKRSYEEKL